MITPLNDRVLVLPDETPETFTGSMLIRPDIAREKPCEGTILQVGDRVKDQRITVGSKILYGKFSGAEIELDGVECLMMQEEEIMALVVNAEPQAGIPTERIEKAQRKQAQAVAVEEDQDAREPIECPLCTRLVRSDHVCAGMNGEVVTYDEVAEEQRLRTGNLNEGELERAKVGPTISLTDAT
jgi:chaperonin GroES